MWVQITVLNELLITLIGFRISDTQPLPHCLIEVGLGALLSRLHWRGAI